MSLPAVSLRLFGVLFLLIGMVSTGAADPVEEGVDRDQLIRQWVRKLDADQFAQRQQAATELAKFGKDAVPAIERAAVTGSGEVASRSVDLLKLFAGSPEEETATMALSSLQRLAASGNQTASHLAKEAISILKRRIGPNRIIGDELEVERQPLDGQVQQSVQISNVNGEKTIDISENGQRTVTRTSRDGHIRVTWDLPNGKQKTVEAASEDELKKKDAEAFARLNHVREVADAGPARIPGLEQMPRIHVRAPRPRAGFDPFSDITERVEAMRARHEEMLGEMQQQLDRRFAPPRDQVIRVEPHAKQLEAVRVRLGEMLKKMEDPQFDGIDAVDLNRLDEALKQIESTLEAS
ncbi:hypothetical protein AB1L30_08465 [Bremerella sp. JC817]|uniref:hypothetical protein n=1 Tax=Bremerella sp. JC817 TaxID=3231756 RepID=UPI00345930A7